MEKRILILFLVIIIVGILINLFIYLKDYRGYFRGDLLNCIEFRTSNISVKANYPEKFKNSSYLNSVRLEWERNLELENNKEFSSLSISDEYYQDLEDIIEYSLIEQGPKYKKTNFNGHEAAYDEWEDDNSWSIFYKIPVSDRVIFVSYYSSKILENEKELAYKILDSIKIEKNQEKILDSIITECSN